MANLILNNLPYFIQGDGVSLTAQINLGFSPISATFFSALITNTGMNVTSNVVSVVVAGQIATVTFVAAFSYVVTIILDILPVLPLLSGSVQVSTPWVMTGNAVAGTPDPKVITVQGITGGTVLPVSGTVTADIVGHAGAILDGTAGTPSAGVLTVQGVVGGTVQPVSLGNVDSKTVVMKTGTLVTTAVTANQVILTYTVSALKTFFVQNINLAARLTTQPVGGNGANPVTLGDVSFESPAGTKLFTTTLIGPGPNNVEVESSEPIFFAAGTVVRVVVTPAAATSTTWYANFGGYEK